MRLLYDETEVRPAGYGLWLSARETCQWAHRPGAAWPCSTIAGDRIFVRVDSNGLCDFTKDGVPASVDTAELQAIVADHLPAKLRHLWPVWERPQARSREEQLADTRY